MVLHMRGIILQKGTHESLNITDHIHKIQESLNKDRFRNEAIGSAGCCHWHTQQR